MNLLLTEPSRIPGDLPDISRLTKYRCWAWRTVKIPLSRGIEIGSFVGKLESEESSVIGDSSKDSTEDSSRRNSGALRLRKGQPGRIHVYEGRVRIPFRFGRNTYLLVT